MTFAIEAHPEANPPFAKWMNTAAARAWLAAMRGYLAADVSAWAHARGDTDRQFANVVMYFQALRGLALALNLHPCDLAPYSARRLQADPGENDIPLLWTPVQLYQAPWRLTINGILARLSETYRDQLADGDDVQVEIFSRVDFDAAGGVISRAGQNPPGAPERGYGTWAGASDRLGSNSAETDPPSDWSTVTWNEFDDGVTGYVQAFAPLQWTYDLARAAMQDCVTRGVVDITAKSIAWGAVRNARIAVVFSPDGITDDPEGDVVRIAAGFDAAAVTADEPPSAWRAAVGAMGTLAGLLLSSGVAAPLAAATIALTALVFGVPELLNRLYTLIFDRATVRGYDVWGRPQPYLVKQDLTGSISTNTAPTQVVPPAPVFIDNALPEESPDMPLINEYSGPLQSTGRPSTGSGGGAIVALVVGVLLLLSKSRRGR